MLLMNKRLLRIDHVKNVVNDCTVCSIQARVSIIQNDLCNDDSKRKVTAFRLRNMHRRRNRYGKWSVS